MPRAPLQVVASIDLTDKVMLSWAAVAGATSYSVYKNTTPSSAGATLLAAGVAGTSYNDTTIAAEGLRYYFVKAVVGGIFSGFSGMATGWRELAAPAAGTMDATGHAGFITITWSEPARTRFYNIYRDGVFIRRLAVGVTSYDDHDITPHIEYEYEVRAANFTGETSIGTDMAEASNPAPIAPTDLVATDGTEISRIDITWSAVDYADTYDLYRNGVLLVAGITDNSYAYDVASGTIYNFKVIANGEGGSSGFSNTDSGYAAALGAPGSVTATEDNVDQVDITWAAATAATAYDVYRNATYLDTVTTLSFSDTAAAVGAISTYTVVSRNAVETGAGGSDSGMRALLPDPATVNATSDDEAGIDVTWAAVTGADSYEIYRDGSLLTSGVVALSYFDNTVAACDFHSYYVRAYRAANGGNSSSGGVGASGHRRPTNELCHLDPSRGTTTGADADDTYRFCDSALISYFFNAYTAADSFQIYIDGVLTVDLPNVTGTWTGTIAAGGPSTGLHTVRVVVTHGTGSTEWDYALSC